MFGYPTVQLWQGNSKYLTITIHRLVAEAFVPNPEDLPQVDHKNGDKTDFRPENLEWVTGEENMFRSWRLGKRNATLARGERSGNAKLSTSQVRCIRAFRGLWKQRSMARHFGVTQHAIVTVQTGKVWAHIDGAVAAAEQRKLTDEQVREIRELAGKDGLTQTALAKRFKVDPSTISQIQGGKRHKGLRIVPD